MARETPDALQAFEDYWAMGDARSLPKLAAEYVQRSDRGEPVPTRQARTIFGWSTDHGWQARVAQRITEEAERVREEERKRNKAFRDRVRTGIEYDVRKYLQSLENANGPVLAEDAASLERMTKLFLALGGDPVADKTVQEHTGPNGGPVQVQTIPLPVFGPNDPLNHFDQAAQEEPEPSDDSDPGE
jgi:hypothetical protein